MQMETKLKAKNSQHNYQNMNYLPNILFAIALIIGFGYFYKNVKKLVRNIKLGQDKELSDNKPQRWKNMARIKSL